MDGTVISLNKRTININNKIPLILILRKIQEVTPISKMYTEVVVDNLHKLHYR